MSARNESERRRRERAEDRRRRRRVKQLELPSDEVKPPVGGDWSAWEQRARSSLRRAHLRSGLLD